MPHNPKLDTPPAEEKKDSTSFFKQSKKNVKACMFFMKNVLNDKALTGTQKATLQHHIKIDKDLIADIDKNTPKKRCF